MSGWRMAAATARLLRAVCFSAVVMALHGHALAQGANPRWNELNPAQQQALAPLQEEWDQLDAYRKGKWLAIGNRYAKMKPDEQQRMQERMRDWVRLSPEQRRQARERYAQSKQLDRGQKSAQWEQYQQLPEEQRLKLAEENARRKRLANLPPPAAQQPPLAPIKGSARPQLQQSVTPGGAGQSAVRPSPQPGKQGQP
jgi:Protein of unknown function (DUF3106)